MMRLIPIPPGEIIAGSVKLDGTDLMRVDEPTMRKMRGSKIAMIFQEPMTALNPLMTIGKQIAEMVTRQGGTIVGSARRVGPPARIWTTPAAKPTRTPICQARS